jgi:hypothetical protein
MPSETDQRGRSSPYRPSGYNNNNNNNNNNSTDQTQNNTGVFNQQGRTGTSIVRTFMMSVANDDPMVCDSVIPHIVHNNNIISYDEHMQNNTGRFSQEGRVVTTPIVSSSDVSYVNRTQVDE